jgi:hypothetical protein
LGRRILFGMRRAAAATSCAALVFSVATAVVAADLSPVVLGVKGLFPRGSAGWGTAHPRYIFNGGDPNGTAWKLRWTGWGGPVARAQGLTWIFKPTGGYFRKPGNIELQASRTGRCTANGPRSYTRLLARESLRPGGPLGPWFAWNGLATLCRRT